MYACSSVRVVVRRERHERAQQHELVLARLFGQARVEHRVVRREPQRVRLGGERLLALR